jgi:two-component system sensor histidine kinase RegB
VLHKLWTWGLGVLATLSFAVLFWISPAVPELDTHVQSGELSLHLLGMWIAFATAALLISFFVARIAADARQKEHELLMMEKRLARNDRLASLVTLSAGAAHEIATPLSTIAVTAKEMEHHAARLQSPDSRLVEDAQLIRSQVERCRLILERMGAQGADPLGETPRRAEFAELMSRVRESFPENSDRIRLEIDTVHSSSCVLPFRAAVEAISALVKNALDASAAGDPVILKAWSNQDRIRFLVQDVGSGMTPDVLERVCEPFFTTKPTGRGMGLGAFLAHLFALQLGGELSFQSQPGRGCTAILELPNTIHAGE